MKFTILLTAALLFLPGVVGSAPTPAPGAASEAGASFTAGNAAYEAGDFGGAIDRYTEVANSGIENAALFYNLGNAYFKSGDLGHAILWYERSLRLDPRGDDVRANLAVVRSLLRDQQLVPAQGGARGVLLAWHRRLSATESAAVAGALYALFVLAALCLIFRRTRGVAAIYRPLSWVSPGRLFGLGMTQDILMGMATTAVLALVFAGSAYTKIEDARAHTRSVVVSEEVPVFSGPSHDATIQFKVHEGTIVSVKDDGRAGWVRVDLPGDLSGWVDAGTVERI
jgi:tetratricopeptide (TPR) repeat protein